MYVCVCPSRFRPALPTYTLTSKPNRDRERAVRPPLPHSANCFFHTRYTLTNKQLPTTLFHPSERRNYFTESWIHSFAIVFHTPHEDLILPEKIMNDLHLHHNEFQHSDFSTKKEKKTRINTYAFIFLSERNFPSSCPAWYVETKK